MPVDNLIAGLVREAAIDGIPIATDTEGLIVTRQGSFAEIKDLASRQAVIKEKWQSAKVEIPAHAVADSYDKILNRMEENFGRVVLTFRTTKKRVTAYGCVLTEIPPEDFGSGEFTLQISATQGVDSEVL